MRKVGRPEGSKGKKRILNRSTGLPYGDYLPGVMCRGEEGYLSGEQKAAIDDEIERMKIPGLGKEMLKDDLSNSKPARLWLTHLREEAEIDQFHMWVIGEMVRDAHNNLGKATRSNPKARAEGLLAAAFLSDAKRGRMFMRWIGFRPEEIRTWVSLSKMVLRNMTKTDATMCNAREGADV